MEYIMDDLVPIVAKLTDKYTMKESTSVSYEVAQRLMGAVTYCLDEFESNENGLMELNNGVKPEIAFEKGYTYVIEKVYKSKDIYEHIIKNFEDYKCKNYSETIIKGMPGFFVNYDAKFNPQNHILTLDYPTVNIDNNLCGVDLIYEYLKNISIECEFLANFDSNAVQLLLESIQPDYHELYLDNICYCVLLNAIGCAIVDKSIRLLNIDKNDCKLIASFFEGDTQEKIEEKLNVLISIIITGISEKEAVMKSYLLFLSHDYAIRIFYAIQNNTVEIVFRGSDK